MFRAGVRCEVAAGECVSTRVARYPHFLPRISSDCPWCRSSALSRSTWRGELGRQIPP